MMLLIVLLAANMAFTPPQDSVVVDSEQTLEQAIAGTTAPDSIIQNLAIVTVEYYSFDDQLHRGQMVVHKTLVGDVVQVFQEIKRQRFPVQSVIPVKFDKPDNGTSMDTLNNSYGFHYRPIVTSKTTRLSVHSYGRAMDINPFQNPAILQDGTILPKGGNYDPEAEGTLMADSPLVLFLEQLGWSWGGAWVSLKDYMHFEK